MVETEKKRVRLLPHNEEAERAILGAILLNESAYDRAVEARLRDSDFCSPANRSIFEAISEIKNQKRMALDTITLATYLEKKDLLERVGGYKYIAALTEADVIVANIAEYVAIIKNLSLRRRMIEISSAMSGDALNETEDASDILDHYSSTLLDLSEEGISRDVNDIKDLVSDEMEIVDRKIDGTYIDDAISTGFSILDKYTNGGFRNQEFIIVAARPSIGKTAFGVSLIREMLRNNLSLAFFSLEMPAPKITVRLLANFSRVPARNISNGDLPNDVYDRVQAAADSLYEKNLYIIDIPNIRLSDLRARARRLKREKKIDCLFIDYIGLVDCGLSAQTPRHEAVSLVSRSLKQLARELNIPVVVLCQATRDSEDREPILSNLRESGSIEQDADLVMFLHRKRSLSDEEMKMSAKDEEGNPVLQVTKLIVAKNRNGETGTFKIGFNAQTTSFENVADQKVQFIEPTKPEKR